MIFSQFQDTDIVAGRTTRVASGFWPDGYTDWSSSYLEDNFYSLTQSVSPSPSYGSSFYDVRKTMYYLDVYPNSTYKENLDSYFSITYGHIAGDVGSGSFTNEVDKIKVSPTKTVYSQYKNMLLGTLDEDGKFSFLTGSGRSPSQVDNIDADDIFVISFSSYKMKDRIDESILELTFTGNLGSVTLKDDSPYQTQVQSVYNLISGSVSDSFDVDSNTVLNYPGLGLFYPSNGVIVINASKLHSLIGIPGYTSSINTVQDYTYNHYAFYKTIKDSPNSLLKVRKSEYVPGRHYFIRVKNRDFNYSNNPTYVYDGTDGIHAKGSIRNKDFIQDPRTYITTVGLYNDANELIAVGKLSKPVVKTFDSEVNIKVMLSF
jgi:hypothetical protein